MGQPCADNRLISITYNITLNALDPKYWVYDSYLFAKHVFIYLYWKLYMRGVRLIVFWPSIVRPKCQTRTRSCPSFNDILHCCRRKAGNYTLYQTPIKEACSNRVNYRGIISIYYLHYIYIYTVHVLEGHNDRKVAIVISPIYNDKISRKCTCNITLHSFILIRTKYCKFHVYKL